MIKNLLIAVVIIACAAFEIYNRVQCTNVGGDYMYDVWGVGQCIGGDL